MQVSPMADFAGKTVLVTGYERVFGANVKGLFFCLKHEITAMRAGGGAIVTVGSIAGEKVIRGNGIYNASKSAANMLTRTAALEAAEHGIRARGGAAAGSTLSEADIADAAPLKRVGAPEDIAAAPVPLLRASRLHHRRLALCRWRVSSHLRATSPRRPA